MKMTMARQDFFNLQVKALKQLRELHRDPSFGKLLDRAVWKAPTASPFKVVSCRSGLG